MSVASVEKKKKIVRTKIYPKAIFAHKSLNNIYSVKGST